MAQLFIPIACLPWNNHFQISISLCRNICEIKLCYPYFHRYSHPIEILLCKVHLRSCGMGRNTRMKPINKGAPSQLLPLWCGFTVCPTFLNRLIASLTTLRPTLSISTNSFSSRERVPRKQVYCPLYFYNIRLYWSVLVFSWLLVSISYIPINPLLFLQL